MKFLELKMQLSRFTAVLYGQRQILPKYLFSPWSILHPSPNSVQPCGRPEFSQMICFQSKIHTKQRSCWYHVTVLPSNLNIHVTVSRESRYRLSIQNFTYWFKWKHCVYNWLYLMALNHMTLRSYRRPIHTKLVCGLNKIALWSSHLWSRKNGRHDSWRR